MRHYRPDTLPKPPRSGPCGGPRVTVPTGAAPGDVFARERQDDIARLVAEHGRVRVSELSARFGVSTVTIRKDLASLEAEGRVLRTHGGALLPDRDRRRPRSTSASGSSRTRRPDRRGGGRARARRRLDRDGRQHDRPRRGTPHPAARRLEQPDRHHQRPADRDRAGRYAGDHGPDDGRARALAGDVRGGPPRRWPLRRINVQTAFMGAAGFALEPGPVATPPTRRRRSSARWSPPPGG